MAIEAHKCNVKGCNGLVVFENADFDLQNPDTIKGVYALDNPTCNVCGKEFLVVPSYSVIDFDEETQAFKALYDQDLYIKVTMISVCMLLIYVQF